MKNLFSTLVKLLCLFCTVNWSTIALASERVCYRVEWCACVRAQHSSSKDSSVEFACQLWLLFIQLRLHPIVLAAVNHHSFAATCLPN